MLNKLKSVILFSGMAMLIVSCSPAKISANYYYQNEKALDSIEESYKDLYPRQPFTIGFSDKEFKTISLTILTDTLSYIYEFLITEARLTDTLVAFRMNAPKIIELIRMMQNIRCAWVNNLYYYVDEKRNSLIFISIKPTGTGGLFSPPKYYALAYFFQPQYFDKEGQLLDKKSLRRLRKINGSVFHRINDKVCYTISVNFR